MTSLVKTAIDPASGAVAMWFAADGWVPNNRRLPAIFFRAVIDCSRPDPAAAFKSVFRRNGWEPRWRNGVYSFHHYHSTAHEVLGFAAGTARLMLGGPNGHEITVSAGDCALLPAGTGHFRIDASRDFLVVGAYAPDQSPDLCRSAIAKEDETRMAELAFPNADPVLGSAGPLCRFWTSADGR